MARHTGLCKARRGRLPVTRQQRITKDQKLVILNKLRKFLSLGMLQHESAEHLGLSVASVRSLCSRNGIIGWPTGAASRDQRGSKNPFYKNGLSKATVSRETKRVVLASGRSLYLCERCGSMRKVELPRHHKDRNRANNDSSNIEVLCIPCHNKEHIPERIRKQGRFLPK